MRNETGELLPFFVQIDDMSVLPLHTLSSAPPAHCVPANLTMAMEFQPELHCRIAELRLPPATPHGGLATSELMSTMSFADSDVGWGLTARTRNKSTLDPPVLVHQRSPTTPVRTSPLVPRRAAGYREVYPSPPPSGWSPRKRLPSAEL